MGGANYQSMVPPINGFGYHGGGRHSISGVLNEATTRPQAQDRMDIDERVMTFGYVKNCFN